MLWTRLRSIRSASRIEGRSPLAHNALAPRSLGCRLVAVDHFPLAGHPPDIANAIGAMLERGFILPLPADPETLAQIDGVFVTVKPYGGSQMPSGKSLLFAYLRADSNHP